MDNVKKIAVLTALLGSVAFTTAANAMPIGKIYDLYPSSATRVDVIPESQAIFGGAARLDRLNEQTAQATAERYYDFDALITLGSLALAGGALAAVAFSASRRRREESLDEAREPGAPWRDIVMQNLEADLTAYVNRGRRAA